MDVLEDFFKAPWATTNNIVRHLCCGAKATAALDYSKDHLKNQAEARIGQAATRAEERFEKEKKPSMKKKTSHRGGPAEAELSMDLDGDSHGALRSMKKKSKSKSGKGTAL